MSSQGNFRYTLSYPGTADLVIDDPNNWKDAKRIIKRSDKYHGIFYEFLQEMEIDGAGFVYINDKYESDGLSGIKNLKIKVERFCAGTWENRFEGVADAETFHKDAEQCIIKISFERTGIVQKVLSREKTEVDIWGSETIGGEAMTNFARRKIDVDMHHRDYKLENKYERFSGVYDLSTNWTGTATQRGLAVTSLNIIQQELTLGLTVDQQREVFQSNTTRPLAGEESPAWSILNVERFKINEPLFQLQVTGQLDIGVAITSGVAVQSTVRTSIWLMIHRIDSETGDWVWVPAGGLGTAIFFDDQIVAPGDPFSDVYNIPINHAINVLPGDTVQLVTVLHKTYNNSSLNPTPNETFEIVFDPDSHIEIVRNVTGDDVTRKAAIINEFLASMTEAISDKELKFFSNYYGRTDSLPLPADALGNGANRFILNGLSLRGKNFTEADPTESVKLVTSLEDTFKNLRAIDAVGMAIINDPDDGMLLNIEPLRAYYDNTQVALTLNFVKNIETEVDSSLIFSAIESGYENWEASFANGLFEFCSERGYSIPLNSFVENKLSLVASWIAAGYLIEDVKRLETILKETTDFPFDDDLFIVDARLDGGHFVSRKDENISNINHVLKPETAYNYLLSPASNLARWVSFLASSFQPVNGNIKFQSGSGNYVAEHEYTGARALCPKVLIKENNNFPQNFSSANCGLPYFRPEIISFEYQLTAAEFQALLDNPFEMIAFSKSNTGHSHGYIKNVERNEKDGMATITLLRAIPNL